jgi:O-antigen/teichoic acid export membrane protein
MFNIRNQLKELSFYFGTQILLIATPIIYIPLISSFLSPEEFGKTSLFLMLLSFSSQLFYGPISNGTNKFYYLAFERGKLAPFYNSIERIIVRISGLLFLIIVLLYQFSKILEDFTLFELILIYFVINLFGIYVIYNGILGVQRQRSKQMFLEICINFSKLLSIFLAFNFVVKSNTSVILATLLSLSIAFVLLCFFLNYSFTKFIKSFYYTDFFSSKIIRFALPFTLWAPFLNGYFLSDRFLIKHFMSLSDLGNYSIQYQLTFSSMQLCSSLLTGFLLPILLQESYSNKSFKKNYRVLIYSSFLFIFFGLLGAFFLYNYGEILLHLFLKKEYLISSKYLFVLTVSGSIYGASQILAIKQTLENKNTKLLYCNITLSVIGLILNYFSIQFFGIDGVVYSLLLLSCLWYLGILLLFKLK